jgi:WD40 repeat protein
MTIPADHGGGAWATIDPSGSRVAVVGLGTAHVELWSVGAGEPTWQVELADDDIAGFRLTAHIWFSNDGERLYVPLSLLGAADSPAVGLYTVDADNGEVLDFLRFPCLVRVMPAGTHFAEPGAPFAFDWAGEIGNGKCDGDNGFAGVVNAETGEVLFQTPLSPGRPPTISTDGSVLGVAAWFLEEDDFVRWDRVLDTTTGEILFETSGLSHAVLTADGTRVLVGQNPTYLYDVSSGERLQTYQGNFARVFFTPDETRVIGTGQPGVIRVFDTDSGRELIGLRGHSSWAVTIATDKSGETLVSSSFDSARVWDISETARGELASVALGSDGSENLWMRAISTSEELMLVRRGEKPRALIQPDPFYRYDVIRLNDDEVLRHSNAFIAGIGPGGVVFEQPILGEGVITPNGVADAAHVGVPRLVDAISGDVVRQLDGCDWYSIENADAESGENCQGVAPLNLVNVMFSADGSTVVGATPTGEVVIWDVATGSVIRHTEPTFDFEGGSYAMAISPDGSILIKGPSQDALEAFFGSGAPLAIPVVDIATWTEIATIYMDSEPEELRFDPVSGLVFGVDLDSNLLLIDPATWDVTTLEGSQAGELWDLAVSPDGNLVATVGADEFVQVWAVADQSIVAEIRIAGNIGEGLRGVRFENDTTLLVGPELGGEILRFTLARDLLSQLALDSVNRGFTEEECATFDIDPCPTLAEMRAGS